MVWIPGGTFLMGSNAFYREERPVRPETTAGFWIDRHPVTNAQFRRFVEATGYVTFSERTPTREMYPDAAEEFLVPGSLVFVKPPRPVSLRDHRAWWAYVPGANWRHPNGPNSSIAHRDNHPVVHVNYDDAQAFAAWAGKALPSEVEWEFAARGGLEGAAYAWGDAANPDGRYLANTWQGRFPFENLAEDGFEGTSPVDAFPPNGYGLHDVCGNVWEWTVTPYAPAGEAEKSCCHREGPDPRKMLRVVKGGSHLCAPN
ncbi:MAG: formylglycine-generating enzyme family protein, partial [Bradyrhizobium icense]